MAPLPTTTVESMSDDPGIGRPHHQSGQPADELRDYTVLTAKLLGIDLDQDEIEPVATQVARVAALVDRLDRVDDDAITAAPRFVAGRTSPVLPGTERS